MLKATGIVVIPQDMNYKEATFGKNVIMSFYVYSINPKRPEQENKYQMEVWVPTEEHTKFKEKIKFNNRFFVSGNWVATEVEQPGKNPWVANKFQVQYRDMLIMRPNSWFAND